MSARSVNSGIALHSLRDPMKEARAVAMSVVDLNVANVLLIGGGLGYLVKALAERLPQANIILLEPEPELRKLALRSGIDYRSYPNVRVIVSSSVENIRNAISSCPKSTKVVISPYLKRLARTNTGKMFALINSTIVEEASAHVYSKALEIAQVSNAPKLEQLPSWKELPRVNNTNVCVVGAGPSLNQCGNTLIKLRKEFLIVAASGAVPPLLRLGIKPDCVIALEALESCARDLRDLPTHVSVVVFGCTNPTVVSSRECLYSGACDEQDALQTYGGTTVLPALHLAMQWNPEHIYLIGIDLDASRTPYADGAMRDSAPYFPNQTRPKFRAMRFNLERLLSSLQSVSQIWHVIEHGNALKGTTQIRPDQFPNRIVSTKAGHYIHA